MSDVGVKRLKEILKIAETLKWIHPIEQPNKRNYSYPMMQLSEVEKCMLAMIDDNELAKLRIWGGME